MVQTNLEIKNGCGIHARPASELAKIAKGFQSDASIIFNGKKLNCKSILNLLTGQVVCGSSITLEVQGEDEKLCLSAIEEYLINLEE